MDTEVKKALDLRLANGNITLAEYKEMLRTIAENEIVQISKAETPVRQPSNRRNENLQPILVVDQDLSLFDVFLVHQGNKFAYTEIKSLSFSFSRMTLNFVPMSNMSSFSIEFDNGHQISYFIDKMFVRGQQSKLLEQAYLFLQKLTFQQRIGKVIINLKENGFVDIPSKPVVRLYRDGTVVDDKQQRLNLKECKRNNALYIGMRYGFGANTSTQPYEIRVYEKPSRFSKTKIIFFLSDANQDIWKSLIAWLAETKNLI
ncbi:MAG: hypothetical protein ACYDH8_01570 [Syntrophales bacterium]